MNKTVATQPDIAPVERLALTFFFAAVFHAVIVFGVVFPPGEEIEPRYELMEVVLVQRPSETENEAKVLAQANQRGGGDVPQEIIPATSVPPPLPDKEEKNEEPAEAVEQSKAAATTVEAANKDPTPKTEEQAPSAAALLTNSFRVAALDTEIKRKLEAKGGGPKRKFISANTREYKYAAYMEAWRAKVERVGNLNYPEEARRNRISGNLVLDVALNPDGSINQITVRRSSGHRILDDAAIRIVELAAPYAPFPDGMRAETDILHITRNWQFLNNREFR